MTYEFNGEPMTLSAIHKLIPCVRTDAIKKHLANGRNTTQAILCYVPPKPPKPGPGSQFVIGNTRGFQRLAPSEVHEGGRPFWGGI